MKLVSWYRIEPYAQCSAAGISVVFEGVDANGETVQLAFAMSNRQASNLKGTLSNALFVLREGDAIAEDPAAAAINLTRDLAIEDAQSAYHSHGARVGDCFETLGGAFWLMTENGVESVPSAPDGLVPDQVWCYAPQSGEIRIYRAPKEA